MLAEKKNVEVEDFDADAFLEENQDKIRKEYERHERACKRYGLTDEDIMEWEGLNCEK